MNKIEIEANKSLKTEEDFSPNKELIHIESFQEGFKKAFDIINETIEKEIKRVNEYPWMGERIQTLRVYQRTVNEVLKDMEKEL